jgi:hypothetical protein
MDMNQSETSSCLFVFIRGWKYEPPTGQPRMDANGHESKRNLFASIRGYSRLEMRAPDWPATNGR